MRTKYYLSACMIAYRPFPRCVIRTVPVLFRRHQVLFACLRSSTIISISTPYKKGLLAFARPLPFVLPAMLRLSQAVSLRTLRLQQFVRQRFKASSKLASSSSSTSTLSFAPETSAPVSGSYVFIAGCTQASQLSELTEKVSSDDRIMLHIGHQSMWQVSQLESTAKEILKEGLPTRQWKENHRESVKVFRLVSLRY